MDKIAIFPAAGKLGTSIYTHLSRLVDPKRLMLISRHPEKVPKYLLDAGVQTRQANYNESESLDRVFDDTSTLVLISYPKYRVRASFQLPQSRH